MMKPIKVLSLYDGIRCGRLALERRGIPVERYVAYEIDKYAIQIAKKNWPDIEHCGDVFEGDFTQYKGFDLIIGGSPCTYWSLANSKGRECTPDGLGGQLFMQYIRAWKESGCKYFLYENNFSIHKNIKQFISEQFGVHEIMINSALLSAQSRKRCYWTNIPGVTQPEDKGILLKDILESDLPWHTINGKSHTIPATYQKTGLDTVFSPFGSERRKQRVAVPVRIGSFNKGGQGSRIYSVNGKSITVSGRLGGASASTGLYKVDLPDGDYTIRLLTPVEAERLQTLPDNYTEGVSKSRRYAAIGNGWTVDVIRHILKNLHNAEQPLEPIDFKQIEQLSLF